MVGFLFDFILLMLYSYPVQNGLIYYIDYECNQYMDEWNFENWGVKYWSKTPEFIDYINKNNKEA